MHNCRLTRSSLIELALDEMPPAKSMQLLTELNDCPACREEYAALRSTLRVSSQALRSALPGEDFWPGYHARLHSRLLASFTQDIESGIEGHSSSAQPARMPLSSLLGLALRRVATSSVRVPVPAALALMLLLGISFFALRSRPQVSAAPPTPLASVETRTVQVPVIQEKVVTKVIYVEQKGRRARGTANQRDRAALNAANSLARARSDSSGKTAMSLVGFKPTDRLKLTIIKGSYQDEK